MKLLEDRIRKDGTVIGTGIVKVDSFLNHQMDPVLLDQLAAEFAERFHKRKMHNPPLFLCI